MRRHPTELADLGQDLGVLASMLGEGQAYALAEEARPHLQRHRTADEGAA